MKKADELNDTMTLERAAEILDTEHREHYESIEPVNEACEIGRKAIFKQIAQQPEYEADGYADGVLVYDYAKCPVCGRSFEEGANDWGCSYCQDCGQKLDWSEAE